MNVKMAVVFAGATFAGAALIATEAAASLVTNGDFANVGSVWVNNTGLGSDDYQTGGATAPPGWTVVNGNEFWATTPNSYSGLTQSPGNGSVYWVDITGQAKSLPFGGLQQTITTTAGVAYTMTFALGASNIWNPSTDPLAASALTASATGTSLLASMLYISPAPTTDDQWITETLSFTADSNSTTIEFLADSAYTDSKYVGLDDVDVEISTTPLPAAFPLFAGGLGVMGLVARRRKRKNAAAIAA